MKERARLIKVRRESKKHNVSQRLYKRQHEDEEIKKEEEPKKRGVKAKAKP